MSGGGYTYPGYNYLGPGNDIYTEDDVVNSTDFIAFVHDLEYALSERPEDIRGADREAIVSFLKDFEQTGRVTDLLGVLGLGLKYGVESVLGVQYPSMSKKTDKVQRFEQFLYAQRERHLADVWKSKKGEYPDFNHFKKSAEGRAIASEYQKNKYYYKHLKAQWEARNNHIEKEVPQEQEEPQPGPSKRPADTGSLSDDHPSKQPRTGDINQPTDTGDVSPPLTPESASVLESLSGGPDSAILSETARRASEDPAPAIPMDTAEPMESGTDRGPTTGARSDGVRATAGTSQGQSNITWIRPSKPASNSHVNFTKTRILISYGYSTENIQLGNPDYVENITTSMALIPVDYLPFYLSQAEYLALPFGAKVTEVSCKVTPLGTRTAFDTGSTLSGTATSEYVPIGLICEGMNKQFYGRNKEYSVQPTDPMKPTGVKTINPKEMAAKWYKHIGSNALCVPQPIEQYYVHEWNRSENPEPNKLPQYMVHNYGVARMDEKVHQFLINQAVGQQVAHYTYKPKNGLIRSSKDHFVPWNRNGDSVETSFTRPRSMALQFFQDSAKKPVIGDVGLGNDKDVYTLINNVNESYYRMIDNYGAFHPARGATSFEAQSQLHVGLVATPQLNPGTANVSYLNSACYWKVESTCVITFNLNSAFSMNNAISWPLEVTFIRNAIPKYTDGQCLFGNTDTKSGNVSTTINNDSGTDSEYDDDVDFTMIDKETRRLRL